MFGLIPYATRRSFSMSPFSYMYNDADFKKFGSIRTDVQDVGDSYKITADLPGFNKDDIKINLEDSNLVISAERKSETESNNDGYIHRERKYGSFRRSFDVTGIEADKINADYVDGVLTLNLPKKPELKPETRQIAIN